MTVLEAAIRNHPFSVRTKFMTPIKPVTPIINRAGGYIIVGVRGHLDRVLSRVIA